MSGLGGCEELREGWCCMGIVMCCDAGYIEQEEMGNLQKYVLFSQKILLFSFQGVK